MKIQWLTMVAAIIAMGGGRAALGQTPFYYAQATSADPVIAVAIDGVALSVPRATVTEDHKYVTLDMNPQLSSLDGLKTFTFQKPGLGFVGSRAATGAVAARSGVGASRNGLTPSLATSPAAIAATEKPSVLDKPGMTLIAASR
jgi:hypothetical protein